MLRISRFLKNSSIVPKKIQNLAASILNVNEPIIRRASLAKAITLIENKHPQKKQDADKLLTILLNRPNRVPALKIGLTGPPGAGKSTFIEALGDHLTNDLGLKIAVLAIDPSSTKTGGSLLGDKTRMEELSRNMNAYIRPSPNGGTLGGVARTTFESCLLCEAAGYDVILVETVGVGQSEYKVADLVDFFTLIIPPAGGDELQGIKRGIIEVVDAVIVNKSDGDLIPAARRIQMEYLSALKYMPPNYPDNLWRPPVVRVSSVQKDGIPESWQMIKKFYSKLEKSEYLEIKRRNQRISWMWHHVNDSIVEKIKKEEFSRRIEDKVMVDKKTPGGAAEEIIGHYLDGPGNSKFK